MRPLPDPGDRRKTIEARGGYAVHVAVWVADNVGTMRLLTSLAGQNWVNAVSIQESIDQPVVTCEFELFREIYSLTTAPFMSASKLNNLPGSYVPLLNPGRSVKVQTRTLPQGVSAGVPASVSDANWDLVFDGTIDAVDWSSSPVKVECRDLGAALLDRFIEVDRRYSNASGVPVQTIIQDILNDNGLSAITLYTPTDPLWSPRNNNTFLQPLKKAPVLEAIRSLAAQIGWDCKYKWDDATKSFRLTLYVVDRANTTPNYTFQTWQYEKVTQLRVSREGIRNKIRVYYGNNAVLGSDGKTLTQASVLAEDTTSQNKYGIRYMELVEAATGGIDAAAEAQKLADACLADLKEITAEQAIDAPYFFAAELGDLYRWKANAIHYDTDQDLAVVGITHTLGPDGHKTAFTVRGKPAGKYLDWHQIGARPGIGPSVHTAAPVTPATVAATATFNGAVLSYDLGSTQQGVSNCEVHVGSTPGFTPASGTRYGNFSGDKTVIGGIAPGLTRYAKVIRRDAKGLPSAASAEVSFTSLGIFQADLDASLKRGVSASKAADAAQETGTRQIVFGTEDWDAGGNYNPATSRFTAVGAFKWHFTAQLAMTGLDPGDTGMLTLRKNGSATPVAYGQLAVVGVDADTGANILVMALDATLSLADGDYIELWGIMRSVRASGTAVATKSRWQAVQQTTA